MSELFLKLATASRTRQTPHCRHESVALQPYCTERPPGKGFLSMTKTLIPSFAKLFATVSPDIPAPTTQTVFDSKLSAFRAINTLFEVMILPHFLRSVKNFKRYGSYLFKKPDLFLQGPGALPVNSDQYRPRPSIGRRISQKLL